MYAVAVGYLAGPVVLENNILFTAGGSYRVCIYEMQGNENPAAVMNNDLVECPSALYADFIGGSGGNCPFNSSFNCLVDAAAVNALTDMTIGSSGNVSVDPLFADPGEPDYHLSTNSPVEVRQGGLDLSADFIDDFDGALRTVPWSMGAYEQD